MTGCGHGQHSTIRSEQIERLTRQLGELQEHLRRLQSQQSAQNIQGAITERNEVHRHDQGSGYCMSCAANINSSSDAGSPSQNLSNQALNILKQHALLNTQIAEASTTKQQASHLLPQSIPTCINENTPRPHQWTVQIDFECFVRQPNKSQRAKEYRVKAYKPSSPDYDYEHEPVIKALFSRRSPFQDQDSCWNIFAISTGSIPVDILLRHPYGLAKKVEGDGNGGGDIRELVKVAGCMRWVENSTVPKRIRVEIGSQSQSQSQSGGV